LPDGVVDGPGEVRQRAGARVRAGAGVTKIAPPGGVLSPRDNARRAHSRAVELAMVAQEASAAGVFVMAHAQATEGIKAATLAGVRSIEHGIYLDEDAVSLMAERGTWLVPTLLAPITAIEAVESGTNILESSKRKLYEV